MPPPRVWVVRLVKGEVRPQPRGPESPWADRPSGGPSSPAEWAEGSGREGRLGRTTLELVA